MVRIIMHGCNGKMGQVITGLVADDPNAQIVAGIDIADNRDNGYPVFTDIKKCDVAADVIVDFAAAVAVDAPVVPDLRLAAHDGDGMRRTALGTASAADTAEQPVIIFGIIH